VNTERSGHAGEITRRIYAVAVAASPLALGVATVMMLALATVDRDPVWAVRGMTISEAAATQDRGSVVRLIGEGVDPNARYPVRMEVLASAEFLVTPLESATLNRQDSIVQLLMDHGAVLRDAERHRLMCFLYERGNEDMYVYLAGFAPMEAPIDCSRYDPYW